MKTPEFKFHNLVHPITVGIEDRDEVYEIIQIKAPSNSAAGYHRNIGRIIAKALSKRSMEMQKNITADVFKNVQEIQKLMEQLKENSDVLDQVDTSVKEAPKSKAKKGVMVEEAQASEDKDPSDDELLVLLDTLVIANLDQNDVTELYDCFKQLLMSNQVHKMFILEGYGKPLSQAVATQLSLDDMDLLLAKYVYFFTRLRQSLSME